MSQMNSTRQDLQSFTEFVLAQTQDQSDSVLGLSELFDLWLLEQSSDAAEYTENVAAINASIQDFLNGERGTPAGEHSSKLREEFGLKEA